jgi:hypothetical protein
MCACVFWDTGNTVRSRTGNFAVWCGNRSLTVAAQRGQVERKETALQSIRKLLKNHAVSE